MTSSKWIFFTVIPIPSIVDWCIEFQFSNNNNQIEMHFNWISIKLKTFLTTNIACQIIKFELCIAYESVKCLIVSTMKYNNVNNNNDKKLTGRFFTQF